jgi:hypothetical protein
VKHRRDEVTPLQVTGYLSDGLSSVCGRSQTAKYVLAPATVPSSAFCLPPVRPLGTASGLAPRKSAPPMAKEAPRSRTRTP